jgi:hypothetical protein
VQFAARANNALKRMDVIDAVAPLVPKPHGVRCVLYKSFSPIVRFQHLIVSPFN